MNANKFNAAFEFATAIAPSINAQSNRALFLQRVFVERMFAQVAATESGDEATFQELFSSLTRLSDEQRTLNSID